MCVWGGGGGGRTKYLIYLIKMASVFKLPHINGGGGGGGGGEREEVRRNI